MSQHEKYRIDDEGMRQYPGRADRCVPRGLVSEHGRCFDFWQKLQECERNADLPAIDCPPYFEDYVECLHHYKEKKRLIHILRAFEARKQQEQAIKKGE